jgi:hypothetical protein
MISKTIATRLLARCQDLNDKSVADFCFNFSGPSENVSIHCYPKGFEGDPEDFVRIGSIYSDTRDQDVKAREMISRMEMIATESNMTGAKL